LDEKYINTIRYCLDIKRQKIVYIKNNAQPCGDGYCPLIAPDAPAQYVLEVNAGQMQKIGAAVGDPVLININSNNLQ